MFVNNIFFFFFCVCWKKINKRKAIYIIWQNVDCTVELSTCKTSAYPICMANGENWKLWSSSHLISCIVKVFYRLDQQHARNSSFSSLSAKEIRIPRSDVYTTDTWSSTWVQCYHFIVSSVDRVNQDSLYHCAFLSFTIAYISLLFAFFTCDLPLPQNVLF